jgi:Ca2+-binding RTX toxin-like protein
VKSHIRGRRRRVAGFAAAAVVAAGAAAAVIVPGATSAPAGAGLPVTVADTQFVLNQVNISQAHAARENATCAPGNLTVAACATPSTSPIGVGPNDIASPLIMHGIRQIDGKNNNLSTGYTPWNGRGYDAVVGGNGSRTAWGSADTFFPVMTGLNWRPVDIFGGGTTTYANRNVNLQDDSARVASNLIADQSPDNPAAVVAAAGGPTGVDGSLLIPNKAPAGGVAPPYNGMFALFGQFFDHGLDLVDKDSGHFVRVQLAADDPLVTSGSGATEFFAFRTTLNNNLQARNTTTPWIDQNQTYGSHPSHTMFLREYVCSGPAPVPTTCDAAHPPVATGNMASSPTIPGNLASWADIKTQAAQKLGIELRDYDVVDVPVVLTDEYGRFIRGPQGFPMLVRANGTDVAEGNPAAPVQTVDLTAGRAGAADGSGPENLALRTTHGFLVDIAHGASPVYGCGVNTACTASHAVGLLGDHLLAGDGRSNENIGLTAVHTVFHEEHNRLVDDLKAVITSSGDAGYIAQWQTAPGVWDGDKLANGAKMITEMEYQHLVFEEFARLVEPGIAAFTQYNPTLRADITAEFAHAVYRFGHSLLNPTVDRTLANGNDASLPLLDAFLNPGAFNSAGGGTLTGPQAAGAVARGMSNQVGNEIDEFVTDTLRNTLLGQPLDLATLNILRGRDTGTQSLNDARAALFASTNGDPSLAPYTSWAQFRLALRHPESAVNFIAAYGAHPSITGASTLAAKRAAADALLTDAAFMNGNAGLDTIDLWIGGLAEKPVNNLAGSMLGPTFAYVFRTQLENLQDSDRFYYLGRLEGTNLVNSIEGNTFAEMVQRNTDATAMPANAFLHAAHTIDMSQPADPALVTINPAGTWVFTKTATPNDTVWAGTPNNDGIQAGTGDDTIRGNDGNDRIEGGLGNDNVVGGLGNDILTDVGGGNTFTGGDGNDYMSGAGADAYLGGNGHDFMVGTSGATVMIGGTGNDLMSTGLTDDVASGDDNSDWIDGGTGIDTLDGDTAPPFSIDLGVVGDDVVRGGAGGDIVNGDGGVDVFPSNNSDEGDAVAGGFGFDFQTYGETTTPVSADLNLGAPPAGVPATPDTFLDVEGVSGGDGDDTLQGDNRTDLLSATPGFNDNLNTPDIAKFRGLDAVLGGATGWTAGNILLGGGGNDTLEGRGGDDLIDGDRSLVMSLSVPVTPVTPTCPGITGTITADPGAVPGTRVLASSVLQLRQAILAGCLDPATVSYVRTVAPGTPSPATDVAVFSGAKADYTVTSVNGRVTVKDTRAGSPDGTDTLVNVETLRFSDGDVPTGGPFGPTTFPSAEVTPASLVPGATGKVTVAITTTQAVPANGTVRITFPAGFDLSGVAAAVTFGGTDPFDGTGSVNVSGQTVVVTRSGGTASPAGSRTITLSGITNPGAAGPTGTFGIATTNATPADLETGTAAAVTLVSPAPPVTPPPATPPAAAAVPPAPAPAPASSPVAPAAVPTEDACANLTGVKLATCEAGGAFAAAKSTAGAARTAALEACDAKTGVAAQRCRVAAQATYARSVAVANAARLRQMRLAACESRSTARAKALCRATQNADYRRRVSVANAARARAIGLAACAAQPAATTRARCRATQNATYRLRVGIAGAVRARTVGLAACATRASSAQRSSCRSDVLRAYGRSVARARQAARR